MKGKDPRTPMQLAISAIGRDGPAPYDGPDIEESVSGLVLKISHAAEELQGRAEMQDPVVIAQLQGIYRSADWIAGFLNRLSHQRHLRLCGLVK